MKLNITFCNLNVTEVRDSDFKNSFLGIFDFTVGILQWKISLVDKMQTRPITNSTFGQMGKSLKQKCSIEGQKGHLGYDIGDTIDF